MSTLKEINEQVYKLNMQRAEILRKSEEDAVAKFKTFEWIKECSGSLSVSAFLASGIDRYTINLYGPVPGFEHHNYIPIYKSVSFINYNQGFVNSSLSFGYINDTKSPKIVTSNTNDLIEFLNMYKFKSLSFNEEDAKLYHFLFCMEK